MQSCKICCLYSGSKGNCTFISAGGANILIDAGKSCKALCAALADIGVGIDSIDAIFVTHEHNDHISALRTLSHKRHIPIHILLSSASAAFRGLQDERLCNCLVLYRGQSFEADVKGLHVKAFPTSHDSCGSVGYRLTYRGEDGEEISVACCTDTGYVTDEMRENLTGCRAVVLESNHDPEMLAAGPYPYELKCRIRSRCGHLSNAECASLAGQLSESGTEHVMLAHLSEENNLPSLAYNEVFSAIAREDFDLRVAKQDEAVWLIGQQSSTKT
ncbi:MAG: MBL fold metallo-hydrolase [Clostridia bacterium]|nr:MBL fold metallo-hydrolase [Clostridia bacterium]